MREYVCHKCGEVPKAMEHGDEMILACDCEVVLRIARTSTPTIPDNWNPRVDES